VQIFYVLREEHRSTANCTADLISCPPTRPCPNRGICSAHRNTADIRQHCTRLSWVSVFVSTQVRPWPKSFGLACSPSCSGPGPCSASQRAAFFGTLSRTHSNMYFCAMNDRASKSLIRPVSIRNFTQPLIRSDLYTRRQRQTKLSACRSTSSSTGVYARGDGSHVRVVSLPGRCIILHHPLNLRRVESKYIYHPLDSPLSFLCISRGLIVWAFFLKPPQGFDTVCKKGNEPQ
jgi:hypothetical protein